MTTLATCSDNVKVWGIDQKNVNAELGVSFRPHQADVHRYVYCGESTRPARVNTLRWNRNNQVLATGSDDGTIAISHFSGKELGRLSSFLASNPAEKERILSVYFSVGSRYLVSGGTECLVKIWDLKKRELIRSLKGHTAAITTVSFCPTDAHVASGSEAGKVIVFSVLTGHAICEFVSADGTPVCNLQYSPFRKTLLAIVTDGGTLELYDTDSRSQKAAFRAVHGAPATSACFSPVNNLLLATGGLDGHIHFFDVVEKRLVKSIKAGGPITAVHFLDDGSTIAAGRSDGVVELFDLRRRGSSPLLTLDAHKPEPVRALLFQHKSSTKQGKTPSKTPGRKAVSRSSTEALQAVAHGDSPQVAINPSPATVSTFRASQSREAAAQQNGAAPKPTSSHPAAPSVDGMGIFSPLKQSRSRVDLPPDVSLPRASPLRSMGTEPERVEDAKSSTPPSSAGSEVAQPSPAQAAPSSQLARPHGATTQALGSVLRQSASVEPAARASPAAPAARSLASLDLGASAGRMSQVQTQAVQGVLSDTLRAFRQQIHDDIAALHVDMIHQFQRQQNDLADVIEALTDKYGILLEEIELLRDENRRLRGLV